MRCSYLVELLWLCCKDDIVSVINRMWVFFSYVPNSEAVYLFFYFFSKIIVWLSKGLIPFDSFIELQISGKPCGR